MIRINLHTITSLVLILPLFLLVSSAWTATELCYTTQDANLDGSTRAAIEAAAQQLFANAAAGNATAMQQMSIPAVAGSFQGIANTVQGNKDKIAGGQAHIRSEWLLDAPGTQTYERAEFFCGAFNSPQRTSFVKIGRAHV